MQEIISYFAQLPAVEWVAVILSLAYVIFAANNNSWCWPAAFISTIIYAAIFYDVQLLMDSLLQVYYLIMAIYGWYCWHNNSLALKDGATGQELKAPIKSLSGQFHLIAISILTLLSLGLGWLMDNFTNADFAYLDSATTVFAVFATYLVAKKVLENWLYFVVIDFVSIYLYIEKSLTPTAFLFAIYVVIATLGYSKWRKIYQQEQQVRTQTLVSSQVG